MDNNNNSKKEVLKKLSDIFKACSEGRTIQVKDSDTNRWCDVDLFLFKSFDINREYRIKPEPCLKKYDRKTLMEDIKKHGGIVVEKGSEVCRSIEWFDFTAVKINGFSCPNFITYDEFLKRFVWFDDLSVCGRLYE